MERRAVESFFSNFSSSNCSSNFFSCPQTPLPRDSFPLSIISHKKIDEELSSPSFSPQHRRGLRRSVEPLPRIEKRGFLSLFLSSLCFRDSAFSSPHLPLSSFLSWEVAWRSNLTRAQSRGERRRKRRGNEGEKRETERNEARARARATTTTTREFRLSTFLRFPPSRECSSSPLTHSRPISGRPCRPLRRAVVVSEASQKGRAAASRK